jgi:WD40 repeat protein
MCKHPFCILFVTILFNASDVLAQAEPNVEPACVEVFELQIPFENAQEGRISWSPDGRYAAQAYSIVDRSHTVVDSRLLIFDASLWQIVADFERQIGTGFSNEIVWSPNSERLAVHGGINTGFDIIETNGWQRSVVSYAVDASVEETKQMVWTEDGQELVLTTVDVSTPSDEGVHVASATKVYVWNVANRIVEIVHQELNEALVRRHDSNLYIALRAQDSNSVTVFRLGDTESLLTLENVHLLGLESMENGLHVSTVEFAPQLTEFATLRLWEVSSGEEVFQLEGSLNKLVWSALVPHTQLFVALSQEMSTADWVIYNVEDGATIYMNDQRGLLVSPNGRFVAALDKSLGGGGGVTVNSHAYITDILTGEMIARLPVYILSHQMAWSLDSLSVNVRNSPTTLANYSFANCPIFNG